MKRALLALSLIAVSAPAWAGPARTAQQLYQDTENVETFTKAECKRVLPLLRHRVDEIIAADGNVGNSIAMPILVCEEKIKE